MTARRDVDRRQLIALTWVYLGLLVIEGALRKWILPELSDPLLLARDPIALAMLAIAARGGILRPDRWTRTLTLLFGLFVATGAVQIAFGIVESPTVVLYGLRTYFLHLPVVFIMGRVVGPEDLRRLMIVVLTVAVPIAVLMVVQFRAAPTDWINLGVGEGGRQMPSALGRIRPAGPFSFISGPSGYYSLVLACLLGAPLSNVAIPALVRWGGWTSLALATLVSGSRGFVSGLLPVFVAALAGVIIRPQLALPLVRTALVAGVIFAAIWRMDVAQDGADVFAARMQMASADRLVVRWLGGFSAAVDTWTATPWLGYGIGRGTNVAGALLGSGVFGLGESEWMRVYNELGPVLGTLCIAWRICFAGHLVSNGVRAIPIRGLLPLLLCAGTIMNLIEGQWSQPTTQGFAVFTAGLALAAAYPTSAAEGTTR